MFKERHSLNVGECPWSRRIFSKSETRWRFNGTTIPNRTSHSSFFVARVLAPVAAANRMCSVTSHDPKLAIPVRVFSSIAWISLAVTLCNRGGTMATTPAFIVLAICEDCPPRQKRNERLAIKFQQFAIIKGVEAVVSSTKPKEVKCLTKISELRPTPPPLHRKAR
jgi:hypothetical protein